MAVQRRHLMSAARDDSYHARLLQKGVVLSGVVKIFQACPKTSCRVIVSRCC